MSSHGFSLSGQNIIAMIKSLDKQKKGSFWWRDNLKLLNIYKGIAHVEARKGDSIYFWNDMWNGRVLSQLYPQFFSFIVNKNITESASRPLVDFDVLNDN
jgi:hypothetical protein